MLAEIIFSAMIGGCSGYAASKFRSLYEEKKIMRDIPSRIEKQIKEKNQKFINDGKEIKFDFKDYYKKEKDQKTKEKNKVSFQDRIKYFFKVMFDRKHRKIKNNG